MFNRRRCCCMNNNQSYDSQNNIIETKCNCVSSYENEENSCSCGFDEDMNIFPENPMLAQSYVPIQYMNKTFIPCAGLKMGTIFPELVSPYYPGQSMQEIEYLENSNSIGKGCNECQ